MLAFHEVYLLTDFVIVKSNCIQVTHIMPTIVRLWYNTKCWKLSNFCFLSIAWPVHKWIYACSVIYALIFWRDFSIFEMNNLHENMTQLQVLLPELGEFESEVEYHVHWRNLFVGGINQLASFALSFAVVYMIFSAFRRNYIFRKTFVFNPFLSNFHRTLWCT